MALNSPTKNYTLRILDGNPVDIDTRGRGLVSLGTTMETTAASRFSYRGPTSALNGLRRSMRRKPSGISAMARDFSGEEEPGAGGERRHAE